MVKTLRDCEVSVASYFFKIYKYMSRLIFILSLLILLSGCKGISYVVFYVDKSFDGTVEYMFLKGNKVITVETDTLIYKRGEAVSLRNINKLDSRRRY